MILPATILTTVFLLILAAIRAGIQAFNRWMDKIFFI
jgi:hypothetical protein